MKQTPSQLLLDKILLLLLLCRWWWVLDKFDTFLNVAFETLDSSFDQRLLLLADVAERVGGFFCTGWLECG